MAEHIERESLAADGWHLQRYISGYGYAYVQSMNILDIPAADVVPVVRCKDCIYIAEHAFVETDEAYCSEHDWCVSETYFCADGKRKDGDGE